MNIGRYEVIQELGRGGMAIVYLARDPAMKRQVAVKVLPRQFTFDPQFRHRFQREAEVIAALEHPYIVPIHDFGEHDDQLFIVMRYMPGGTLAGKLAMETLPFSEISAILQRIGSALDYAHSQGVIHRDIKPGNILYDTQGGVFLSDFGIAKISEATSAFTGTAIIGTPEYMSPEQARGDKTLDGRSDIYSLGILLYQSLSGQLPYKADTPVGIAIAHITEPVPSLLAGRPDLPRGYDTVIRRSLDKDPAKRFRTAGELGRAFDQQLSGAEPAKIGDDSTLYASPPPPLQTPGLSSPPVSTGQTPAISSLSNSTAQIPAASSPTENAGKRPFPAKIAAFGGLAVLALCLCAAAGIALATNLIPNPFAIAQASTPTQTATAEATLTPLNETPALPASNREAPAATPFIPVGLSTTYIEYILDASGSMLQTLQGETRLAIAQEVLTSRLKALPPNTQVGLRVYGHRIPYQGREAESCQDIELVVPIQPGTAQEIIDWLPDMQALGMTPMSESIRQAAQDFTFEPGRKNFIVLISDGEETCGEEPAEVVKYLQEIGIDFTIHVIGLDVDAKTAAQLRAIADAAGGVYHDAKSEADLTAALTDLNERMLPTAPPGTEVAQAETPTGPPSEAAPSETAPAATNTPVPEPNAQIASEGQVEASTTFDNNFVAALAVDGDLRTSWFSAGPGSDGTSTYRWTGVRDDFIASIEIISNREHLVVDFRTGYGFEAVTIQVLDAAGNVVFEEHAPLEGTPDPDVLIHPNVVGRSVLLIFTGNEDPGCGGFGELKIGAVR